MRICYWFFLTVWLSGAFGDIIAVCDSCTVLLATTNEFDSVNLGDDVVADGIVTTNSLKVVLIKSAANVLLPYACSCSLVKIAFSTGFVKWILKISARSCRLFRVAYYLRMMHVESWVWVQGFLNFGEDTANLDTLLHFVATFTLELERVRTDVNAFIVSCWRCSSTVLLFDPEILLYQIWRCLVQVGKLGFNLKIILAPDEVTAGLLLRYDVAAIISIFKSLERSITKMTFFAVLEFWFGMNHMPMRHMTWRRFRGCPNFIYII